ncbi:MAG: glycerol-3-phosphate dehydrogenase [Halobacteriales archaeon]|nr:glycerol-3-phosphate dehydrogenase [Halobacteriales archaeon]
MDTPADLESRTFDLLVVGGGINGAAIARDAALRGLSVLLVEMADWGWATSSKSSKLAHGGLRYLENFDLALVHEALQDRERLLRQAPHLVRPLRFLYPLYPHIVARRTVRTGLWLYDLLSRGKSLPNRKYLRRDAALQEAPGLDPEGLAGAATFYDAQIQQVERLVAEMACDARRHGAVTLTRTRLDYLDFERREGRRAVTGAYLETEDGRHLRVRARATVNATGCWVDEVLGALGDGAPPKVRKTKGAHVVVPRFLDVAFMVRAKDARSFFLLPWGEHCVVGTTDTDFAGDPGDAVATAADVEYLTASARRYFPDAPLDQVDFVYAGVRALVNEQGVTESNVTRRHILYDHAKRDAIDGLWTLQGGKITTARTLAEECVDRIARAWGQADLAKRHPTREARYPGGPAEPWDAFRAKAVAAAEKAVPVESAAHLVDTYGARWNDVLDADRRPEAHRPIHPLDPNLPCEVTFAVHEEDAKHLGDYMLRRSTLGLAADGNPQAARRVLDWMAELLGWSDKRCDEEWLRYVQEVRQFQVH